MTDNNTSRAGLFREIESLRSELAAAREERDEWKRHAEADTAPMDEANARAEKAEAEVARLRGALEAIRDDERLCACRSCQCCESFIDRAGRALLRETEGE